jgi:AcrR family transcriptional regulator
MDDASSDAGARMPLSRERVLDQAVKVADAGGLGALTMRSLAQELDVKPMALYHYVAGKDEILDGIVDRIFGEITFPVSGGEWRTEIRRRAVSARDVLRRHTWAITLMESRSTPGTATLRHHEAVLATLRTAGLSLEMTGHAYAMLDAFVYGFVLQEAALPLGPETAPEAVSALAAQLAPDEYPHLMEYATQRVMEPGYDFGDEFEFGLGVILDALERSIRTHDEVAGDDSGRSPVLDPSQPTAADDQPEREQELAEEGERRERGDVQ